MICGSLCICSPQILMNVAVTMGIVATTVTTQSLCTTALVVQALAPQITRCPVLVSQCVSDIWLSRWYHTEIRTNPWILVHCELSRYPGVMFWWVTQYLSVQVISQYDLLDAIWQLRRQLLIQKAGKSPLTTNILIGVNLSLHSLSMLNTKRGSDNSPI